MLKLKRHYFGHLLRRADSFDKTLMSGKTEGRRRRDDRGWDGWMTSSTQWTWVWVNSRSCWWTGRPGMLQSMGLQTVGHDWVTELNWTEDSILGFGMQAFLYKGKIEIFLLEFSSPPMQDRERVTYRGALQDPGCGEPNPHLLISLIHCLNPRVRQSGSRAWWPISGSLLTYLKFVNWEETLCDISPVRTVSNFNFFTCQESLDFGIFIIKSSR